MAAPATPTNLYVQQGNGQVYLSWDIIAGATTYPVFRSLDGVTYSQVAAPAVNSYLDTTVTIGVQYYYQVASSNGTVSPRTNPQIIIPAQTGALPLGAIRLLAQQEADRVNSNFVTLPEWNTYINQSLFELWDLLVTVYEEYHFAQPFLFRTDGSSFQYLLPNGSSVKDINNNTPAPFYKLLGLDLGLDNSNNAWVTLEKFNFIARNRYVYPNITSTFLGVFNLRYRLTGDSVYFIPVPSGGQIIRMWYVPRMPQLLQDTDIADGYSGWLEYVVVDAAIKALTKEESDTTALMARKMALKQRIEETATNRDAGMPDTISATRSWGSSGGGWGGGGFDGSYGGY